ncbi:MAG: hypothetical protein JWQ20_3758, partial [Conexibacter sp.]|nr:hypothetical protein [Conexibacter sp.]
MRPRTQRRIVILVPPLLVALLAVPFLLHQNSWWEWANAYWLLQRQAEHVSAHGTPTYFLHTNAGAFYPHYVFYAGFTFSVLAYPAAVLGAWPVFAAATVAALVAGYLGIWWSARNLGLSARLAVLPALTFATTPYVVSELYGRGAWAELIAVSAVAVMLGGLTALLWHPERGRGGPIAALAGSGAVVAGTHNLTVLMSAIALPLILAALLPLAPRSGGVRGLARRIGLATGAIALGVALTGAWLVPDLWLGPHTSIAEPAVNTRLLWANRPDVWIGNVLSPWPRVPPVFRGISWIHAQPPVLAMVWALVALAALGWAHRHRPDRVTAAAAGLVALGAGLLLVIVDPRWWLSFPDFLQAIQFPYRLITYLAIVIAMAITVALNILRGRRVMVGALVLAVGAQAAMAGFIAVGSKASGKFSAPPQRQEDVRVDEEPPSFSHPRLYTQFQFRTLGHPTGGR